VLSDTAMSYYLVLDFDRIAFLRRLAVEHAGRLPIRNVHRQNALHFAIAVLRQVDGLPELIL